MRRVAWIILAWALCGCSAPTGPSDARGDDIQACNTERVSPHRMPKQEHEASRRRNVVDRLARRIWCAMVAKRSEEHTSELQSLMRISYADFCLKNKTNIHQ